MHGQLVATANDLHRQRCFNLREISVEFSTKVDQKAIVRKAQLQIRRGARFRGGGCAQRGQCQHTLLRLEKIPELRVPSPRSQINS